MKSRFERRGAACVPGETGIVRCFFCAACTHFSQKSLWIGGSGKGWNGFWLVVLLTCECFGEWKGEVLMGERWLDGFGSVLTCVMYNQLLGLLIVACC